MHTMQKINRSREQRSESRYALPVLDVVIGGERFHAINWSMRGALLYGICEIVGMRRQQEVVDPRPLVAVPAARMIVPEGIALRFAMKGAVGVAEPQMKQRAESRAGLDAAQRVIPPGDRVVDILVRRADVVIPGQD